MNIYREKAKKLDWKTVIAFFSLWILISGVLFYVLYFTVLATDDVEESTANAAAGVDTANQGLVSQITIFRIAGSKNNATANTSIVIPKIGLASPIVFPTSTDLGVLKQALYSGVVHYPDSALPGENGNVFIFGHSSNRLIVKNPAFTAFTNLYKLKVGDDIFLNSSGVEYHYRVASVEIVDPKETRIYLASNKPKLTLSTCWPVGDPKNRTVIEAEFLKKTLID